MSVGKKKLKREHLDSLIPAIGKEERQLRQEVKQAKEQAKALIVDAQGRMQEQIAQFKRDLPGITEQMRSEKLQQAHSQAKQLGVSSGKQRDDLLDKMQMNIPKAVQKLVDMVTAMGDRI